MITPSLAELIRLAIETEQNDLHTAMPCKVLEYHPDKSWVDVRPGMKQVIPVDPLRTQEYVLEGYPIIYAVPVAWPSGGGAHMTFPIKEGDTGLLVFCEQPLEMWRRTGEVSGPGIPARHDLNGAVFIPGLRPTPKSIKADPDNVVIRCDNDVVIETGGNVRLGGKDAEDFVALSRRVDAALAAIQTKFDSHTHRQTDGGTPSLTSVPTPLPTVPPPDANPSLIGDLDSVAAAQVQAK